jgi:hypothetical protein
MFGFIYIMTLKSVGFGYMSDLSGLISELLTSNSEFLLQKFIGTHESQ